MTSPRDVLKFRALLAFERIGRLERLLSEALTEAPRSSTGVVRALLSRVRYLEARLVKTTRDFSSLAARPEKIDGSRVLTDVAAVLNDLQAIHERLAFVSGGLRNAQLELFVTAVFEDAAVRLKRRLTVGVVPSDRYEFEQHKVIDDLGGSLRDQSPTVFLPKLEFDNPLHWAPLVHEFGHTLDDISGPLIDGLIRDAAAPTGFDSDVAKSWLTEIFCDLLATHLLGPAYLTSFVEFVACTSSSDVIEASSATHPAHRFRITAIKGLLRSNGVSVAYGGIDSLSEKIGGLFEELAEVEQTYRDVKPRIYAEPVGFRALRRALMEKTDNLIPPALRAVGFRNRNIATFCQRLQDGIPVGAVPAQEIAVADVHAASERLRVAVERFSPSDRAARLSNASMRNLNLLRRSVNERASSVAEVLNAGWIYKWAHIYEPFMIELDSLRDTSIDRFKQSVRRLDEVLRSSIDTAYLAKQLQELQSIPSVRKVGGEASGE